MDQANGATQDELQQAINSITGGGAAANADPVAEITNKIAAAEPAAATTVAAPVPTVAPAAPAMPA